MSQKSPWVSGCHLFPPLRVHLYYLATPSPEFFLSELTRGLLPSRLLLPPSHVLQCWSAFAYFSFTLNPLQTDFPVQCLQGCAEIRLPHNRVHWTPCHPLPIGSQWPPTLWVTPSLEGTCHLAFLTPPLLGFSYLSDFSTNLHMEEFFGAQVWVVFSLHRLEVI